MGRLVRYVVVVVLGGVLTAGTLVALAPQFGNVVTAGTAGTEEAIDLTPLPQRSKVYAADGSLLEELYVDENREPIPLDDVPQVVIDTILTIEDQQFYSHDGLNLRATARALLANVEAGDVRQGGSTITQQLVKNAFLLDEDTGVAEQSLDRKFKEGVLATRLEEQMTKDEILEQYLNTVYFGNFSYGLQAASEVYFGKDAKELGLEEAVFLAGLIQNPSAYDPFRYPDATATRRREVLGRLVDEGLLDQQGADIISFAVPLPTSPQNQLRPRNYFIEEVVRRLGEDERLGATREDRYNAIFRGGLTIRTTLDPRLNLLAEAAVVSRLPDSGGRFAASLVSLDPRTGAVRALVGGPGFEQDKETYNIATQGIGQQPGSSFKPFVLAAALESGLSPRDRISGSGPCTFDPEDFPVVGLEPWEVTNYGGSRGGTYDLYGATQRSLNCSYARLVLMVGPEKAAAMAKRLGVRGTELEPVASLALGAEDVLPLDMASAYGTFANDGLRQEPYFVEEVLDRSGEVLLQGQADPERVIDSDIARTVTDVLRGVTAPAGTGLRAKLPDNRPMAGKTGTTNNSADAWFVGYTPQLSTAVWMGSPVGSLPMENVGGVARVTGGSFPAEIWNSYMTPALQDEPMLDFDAPPEPERGEDLKLVGAREYARIAAGQGPDDDGGGGRRERPRTSRRRSSSTSPGPVAQPRAADDADEGDEGDGASGSEGDGASGSEGDGASGGSESGEEPDPAPAPDPEPLPAPDPPPDAPETPPDDPAVGATAQPDLRDPRTPFG